MIRVLYWFASADCKTWRGRDEKKGRVLGTGCLVPLSGVLQRLPAMVVSAVRGSAQFNRLGLVVAIGSRWRFCN